MTVLIAKVFSKILISSLLCAHFAASAALTSANFEGEPASELGVGPDGATTWLLASGASGLDAPATLVLGASTLGLSYVDPNSGMAINENCGITDGLAACTVVDAAGGFTVTVITTEAVPSFAVQADGSVATPSPTSYAPDSPSTSVAAGSSVTSIPGPSGSSVTSLPVPSGSSTSSVPAGSPSPSSTGTAAATNANGAMETKSLPFLSLAIVGFSIMYAVLA